MKAVTSDHHVGVGRIVVAIDYFTEERSLAQLEQLEDGLSGSQFLPGAVLHEEARLQFFDGPRRGKRRSDNFLGLI